MNKFGWLAILLSVVLGSQWIYRVHGDKPASPAVPRFALSGDDSQISERGIFRITTEKDWIALWQKHKGKKGNDDLIIDFDRFMVIAVLDGKSSNNDRFKAVFQSEDSEKLIFRYESMWYQTGVARPFPNAPCEDDGNSTRAYGFFVLPRSNKPLVVEELRRFYGPDSPKVEERIRFPKL